MLRAVRILLLTIAWVPCAAPALALPLPKQGERWVRADSAHFTFFSNASAKRTAAIARRLEQFRHVLAEINRVDAASPVPILIYAFQSDAALVPYKRNPDGSVMNVSGFFSAGGDADYVAIDASVGPEVIYHEYVHAFMEQGQPNLPLWLSEGIAEFYATFELDDEHARIGTPNHDHLALLRRRGLMPVGDLFAVDAESADYNEQARQGMFYAQSWLLTHYLVVDAERRGRIGEYFARLAAADDPVHALYEVFGLNEAGLQRQLEAYVGKPRLELFSYRFQREVEAGEVAAEPLDYPDVLFRLGDLLAHRPPVLRDEAEAHLRRSLELRPDSAESWVALAHLSDLEERFDEAALRYRKALQLDPRNAHAWSRYGWSRLQAFYREAAGMLFDETPPAMLEARELFRKSLELRAEHPETLAGFGRTFLFETGSGEGIEALSLASRLLPSRIDVLTDLIVQLAGTGQTAGGRALLERALRPRARDPRLVEYAEEALIDAEFAQAAELYNRGQQDAAVAILRDVIERTDNQTLRRKLETRLLSLTGAEVSSGDAVDLYNRAVSAASAGRFDEALEALEQVLAVEPEGQFRRTVEATFEEVRAVAQHNRAVALYNDAVEHFNARRFDRAIEALEQLLAGEPSEDVRSAAEEALADARRAARKR